MVEKRIPAAAGAQAAARTASAVASALAEFRESVDSRVERASETAEEGVLIAGKSIDIIFREARAAANLGQGRGGDGTDIGALAARQSEHVQSYVEQLAEVLDNQAVATRQAMKQSATISEAGIRINDIATSVSVLGLNAQIEASRLGAAGSGFNVIAAEMHELGKQVALANAMIGELATNLAAALPELLRNGDRMKEKSREFTAVLARDIRLMEEANRRTEDSLRAAHIETERRLERIRQASNEALSALQFHDPMVQHLRQLPPLVDEVLRRSEIVITAGRAAGTFDPLEESIHQQVFAAREDAPETGLVLEF